MRKVDKGYMNKKGKKKVQFSMLRPLMITGTIVTLGVLTAWGCSTQSAYLKTEEAPKEAKASTYKEIKIVTVTPGKEEVIPTVTERPDFDIRNLSIIGRNDEDKGENDEDDIRREEVQGAGDQYVTDTVEPDRDAEPDSSGAERDLTEPDGEDSGTEQDDAGEPIYDNGESGSDDQADADYLPDGSQQYDGVEGEPELEPVPEEPVQEDTNDGWVYYCNAFITHYDDCEICCSVAGNTTASGVYPTPNHTVAAGEDLPFNTEVLINGQIYVVEDRGVGYGCIDIFVPNHDLAVAMGAYYTDVYVRYPVED